MNERSELSLECTAAELVPLLLAEHHRAATVGARLAVRVAGWEPTRLHDVIVGAGFSVDATTAAPRGRTTVEVTRLRTLADTVGPAMRTLLVGLNPSVYSADRGIPFARTGNRFWPAAIAAGIVTRDRDPMHALLVDGVGMTDLVKRATARADELDPEEYCVGAARVASLVELLEPGSVCFIGLTGYRVAVDRAAKAGWQQTRFGGRPAYVMPNPSGINAHATPALLVEHLRELHLGRG